MFRLYVCLSPHLCVTKYNDRCCLYAVYTCHSLTVVAVAATNDLRHSVIRQNLTTAKILDSTRILNKKHLKNVGPIRHCEPPHAHSPGVATVALAIGIQRVEMHQHAKFRHNRSIGCEDIEIFRFFKMAAVRHLGFVWGIFGPPTVSIWGSPSLCKIWL